MRCDAQKSLLGKTSFQGTVIELPSIVSKIKNSSSVKKTSLEPTTRRPEEAEDQRFDFKLSGVQKVPFVMAVKKNNVRISCLISQKEHTLCCQVNVGAVDTVVSKVDQDESSIALRNYSFCAHQNL